MSGNGRAATRGGGEVIELECGITVYPARAEGGRWRAVWYEDGQLGTSMDDSIDRGALAIAIYLDGSTTLTAPRTARSCSMTTSWSW